MRNTLARLPILVFLVGVALPAQQRIADLNPLIAATSSAPDGFAVLGTQVLPVWASTTRS